MPFSLPAIPDSLWGLFNNVDTLFKRNDYRRRDAWQLEKQLPIYLIRKSLNERLLEFASLELENVLQPIGREETTTHFFEDVYKSFPLHLFRLNEVESAAYDCDDPSPCRFGPADGGEMFNDDIASYTYEYCPSNRSLYEYFGAQYWYRVAQVKGYQYQLAYVQEPHGERELMKALGSAGFDVFERGEYLRRGRQ